MRIALVQLDPVVGGLDQNVAGLCAAYEQAVAAGAQLVVAGELAVPGYPPEDLLRKRAFVTANERALGQLAAAVGRVPLVAGFVQRLASVDPALWRPVSSMAGGLEPLANAAAVLRDGTLAATYRKQRLPNYGVFDEARYFAAGTGACVVEVDGVLVGVTVCEDMWGDGGPVQAASAAGAQLVLNLNASPYSRSKRAEREHWARHHARAGEVWIAYAHQVGGQDELVFDGDSFVTGPDGEVVARAAQFATDLLVVDLPIGPDAPPSVVASEPVPRLDPLAEVYAALVLGTRDYVRDNGFDHAVVGLSGGIDSALVAVIAADALGADAVTCVLMPSPWSSPGSVSDAVALVETLGARQVQLPIAGPMRAFDDALAEPFRGTEPGLAEENLQSRIRGTLLMALSNKTGAIVLATGNKSEYAVGYSTLYGDMAGGFAVIKDVPKTLVYRLVAHRAHRDPEDPVPEEIVTRPPTAELREEQRDDDSLPPYDILDPILEGYVEDDLGRDALIALGLPEADVDTVIRLVDLAEYKRRQMPPGIKISPRAFGRDRRLPIVNRAGG